MGIFSIRSVIRVHIDELIEDSSATYSFIVFLLLPVIISLILVIIGIHVTQQFLAVLISALAVLIGFTINAVVLLMRYRADDTNEDLRKLVRQTRVHAHYLMVLGFFILSYIIVYYLIFTAGFTVGIPLIAESISFLTYFLMAHFLLTLLLIPARLYVVVENSL